jgi:ABC-type branched-subunit amino acid transport system ATPase component
MRSESRKLLSARALVTNPSLLLDEPSEGLAPSVAATVTDLFAAVTTHGVTVLGTGRSHDCRRRTSA